MESGSSRPGIDFYLFYFANSDNVLWLLFFLFIVTTNSLYLVLQISITTSQDARSPPPWPQEKWLPRTAPAP